ncbi:MAG: hypothetical protein K1X74_13490 [Pirellulales bacterium]|nr:hypothetical protein [Pirellulales bacterium]
MTPAKRRRLQQCYEHGSKNAASGQFDYAHDLFTQALIGDPGNKLYAAALIGNLQKKYSNNKKGSKLASIQGVGSRGMLKKASMSKDWAGVFKTGIDLLKLNPWDTSTLVAMAAACEQLGYEENEELYLRCALDLNIKDPEINRLAGRTLARHKQFDSAVVCWSRVLQSHPDDEEAKRAIADLTVEKTIHVGGYQDAESTTDVMADKMEQAERQGGGPRKLTPEEQLEKDIAKNPQDASLYVSLADMHASKERFADAVNVLERAIKALGEQLDIRERLEDFQLRGRREQVAAAERKYREQPNEDLKTDLARAKTELNSQELEVYRKRCERYPTNHGLKYELGLRQMRAGQHAEAIKALQDARQDLKRKGAVLLALGECFQTIKQYKLALSSYQQAVQETNERDLDQKKLAMYRAGRLALGMSDLDVAEKQLTELAGYDFAYRDVPALLDKIRELRDKG